MIDKFYVMAIIQAARAKSLGLSSWSAKSFGLNRAIFYRAAKFGFNKSVPKLHKQKISAERSIAPEKRDQIEVTFRIAKVGDEKAYAVLYKNKLTFIAGNKLIKPKDFEKSIEQKLTTSFEWVWDDALNLVNSYDKAVLRSQRLFYELVYKANLEELIKSWSKPLKNRIELADPDYRMPFAYAHQISKPSKRIDKKFPSFEDQD